jgi:phage shock protein E
MFSFIKKLFGPGADFKALVQQGALIIDVRTPGEFGGGHIKGSQNIPVDKITAQVEKLKKTGKPIITCCRSGARSGMAAGILKQNGIQAYNGGPWNVLNAKIK